ncbi:MAG: TonB family protein [Chlorobi bacterium]|nr:TonB family protein [Chlorobiota bacterium]
MRNRFLVILFLLLSISATAQNGYLYTYYPSGKVDGVIFFANDVLEGTSYWYYENGNLKAERTYDNGKLTGVAREFYETGLVKEEVSVKDGVRDGITKFYYDNGGLKEVRTYEKGSLMKVVKVDYDSLYIAPVDAYKYGNTQNNIQKNHDLFICEGADVCPKPVGGMTDIMANLKYPEHAKLYGLEGYVTLVARVDSTGKVKEVNVLRGLGLGCDEAAIEAVKATKFLPGQINDKAVESNVLFKIPFVLSSDLQYYYSSPSEEISLNNDSLKTDSLSSATKTVKKVHKVFKNFSCDIDQCARPKEGIKSILDNLDMPAIVKREKIEGAVIVEADVDEYGIVIDTKVISDIGYGSGNAVEMAILRTKFEPGIKDGKPSPCKVRIIVPIIHEKPKENDN